MATNVSAKDRWGTIMARLGPVRNTYAVPPGLYAVGKPTPDSPVLVSANYKLSFDALRFQLRKTSAWLLVLDTRGVNVWCAAGKGTFSTAEIVYSVEQFAVDRVVNHRRLIVPQLAAPGVCAMDVKAQSGFTVVFGPVRSHDLESYLQSGCKADETMRMVTFTVRERAELVPVEFYLLLKPLLCIIPLCLLISGIGPDFFALEAIIERGGLLLAATLAAVFAGGAVVPVLLPWLPGRQFWVKGLLPGMLAAAGVLLGAGRGVDFVTGTAIVLWSVSVSSYLGMNFTGSTPFTSPSGVEYEMKRGLPVQMVCSVFAMVLWIVQPFIS